MGNYAKVMLSQGFFCDVGRTKTEWAGCLGSSSQNPFSSSEQKSPIFSQNSMASFSKFQIGGV